MDVNTMGSQSVHSILWHNWQNRPEDDWSIVETCSLIITLSNKVIFWRTLFNIILPVWAHPDASVQIKVISFTTCSRAVIHRKSCAQHWANCTISVSNISFYSGAGIASSDGTVTRLLPGRVRDSGSHSDSCKVAASHPQNFQTYHGNHPGFRWVVTCRIFPEMGGWGGNSDRK